MRNKGFTQVVDFREAPKGRGKAASRKFTTGFTLIEILLVVAAIGILAGIVIIAINPNKQLGDTKDARRKADVTTILNAVYQQAIDNNGVITSEILSTNKQICASGYSSTTCSNVNLINLSNLTHNEKYLVAIPINPSGATSTTYGTGYYIKKSDNNRITVSTGSDAGGVISATR